VASGEKDCLRMACNGVHYRNKDPTRCTAAKLGPNVLFCMPNRTNCILPVSVTPGVRLPTRAPVL
jgi:hypothetical protein